MLPKSRADATNVVRYCIASEEYRRREAAAFARAVQRMDGDTLVHLLYRANLLPLFAREIARLGIAAGLLPLAQAYTEYQRFYNGELLVILERLASRLGQFRPVLLKGPAFWGDVYDDPALRPVKDLDILGTGQASLVALCRALAADDFDEIPSDRSIAHYEYAQFTRTWEREVDEETAASLALVCRELKPPRIRMTAGRRCRITVPVEVHEAIFIYSDDTAPRLRREHLDSWTLRRRWRVLSRAANLPYLSMKFDFDAQNHVGRSLKLLGDLVRILARATPDDVARSIEIADEWTVTDAYSAALGVVAPLIPEVDLRGLPQPSRRNPLAGLVTDILTDRIIEAPQ